MREIQPNATRILITAVLSLSTVIDAINKGEIYRFVVKPWLREELLATVKTAVQRYRADFQQRPPSGRDPGDERAADRAEPGTGNPGRPGRPGRTPSSSNSWPSRTRTSASRVELCVQTMQTFHPTLGNRARRVQALCQAMGKAAELSPAQQQILEISAAIHDIGLVGIPRQLIKRWEESPESLNEAERRAGAASSRSLARNWPALSIVSKASAPSSAPITSALTAAAIPTA